MDPIKPKAPDTLRQIQSESQETKKKESTPETKPATPGGLSELADAVEIQTSTKFDELVKFAQEQADPSKFENILQPKIDDLKGAQMTSACPNPIADGILEQKINVATPACEGTGMSTCGVPDTDPSFCDTLSGCPETRLGSITSQPGRILEQKINIATPACEGTGMSTCGVPDTDPSFCDTLSGCPESRLGSITSQPGGILEQKTNIATPACEGTGMSTCGVPDTDPSFCDTLSGCPERI